MSGYRPPDFGDQFQLSRDRWVEPAGFAVHTQAGWMLRTGARLPVTVLTHDGRHVGWMLGWAVHPEAGFADDSETLEVPSPDDAEAFEDVIHSFAGRWVCIVTAGTARVYPDPGASLGVVYSARSGAVASTTTLLQRDPSARPRRAPVPAGKFYPFGETSDPHVLRLLPSHLLDLTTFAPERHWPRGPITRVDGAGVAEQVAIIADRLTRVMEHLAQRAPLVLPLTAGRDSRMFVAAARGVLDASEFVTFEYHDQRHADLPFARHVARRFGLRHTVVRLRPASSAARSDYLHAVGYDNSEGKARDFLEAASVFPADRGWVTGFAGEVGRGFYWRDPLEVVTPQLLLKRFRLKDTPQRRALADRWMQSLPSGDAAFVLDMAYIDVRLGGWPSPQQYGTAPFAFTIMPINQRDIFEAMLRLPVDFRRADLLSPAVVSLTWPELDALPYARRPGPGGAWDRARALPFQVLTRLRHVWQGLRGYRF